MPQMQSEGQTQRSWKQQCRHLCVLYAMGEETVPFKLVELEQQDRMFIDPLLTEMNLAGLLRVSETKSDEWEMTEAGQKLLKRMQDMAVHVNNFNVFQRFVNNVYDKATGDKIELPVPAEHEYDEMFLRFTQKPNPAWRYDMWDLRLAVLNYLAEKKQKQIQEERAQGLPDGSTADNMHNPASRLDPHQIVFLDMLGAGMLEEKGCWAKLVLDTYFTEIEDVVKTALQWRKVASLTDEEKVGLTPEQVTQETEARCAKLMDFIIEMGFDQIRKLNGDECESCKAPLVHVSEDVEDCPNCGHYIGPDVEGDDGEEDYDGDGEETVTTVTEIIEEEEEVEEGHYDDEVVVYGPDPLMDPVLTVGLACLCEPLWYDPLYDPCYYPYY